MDVQFNLDEIANEVKDSNTYWQSFLEQDNFELGVLYLEAGQKDTQDPHAKDEVYFVIEGDGYLNIDEVDHPVKPKTALYVPRNTKHHFHSNTIPILCYYALN